MCTKLHWSVSILWSRLKEYTWSGDELGNCRSQRERNRKEMKHKTDPFLWGSWDKVWAQFGVCGCPYKYHKFVEMEEKAVEQTYQGDLEESCRLRGMPSAATKPSSSACFKSRMGRGVVVPEHDFKMSLTTKMKLWRDSAKDNI